MFKRKEKKESVTCTMLDKDFLRAMVEVLSMGLKDGRVPDDWKQHNPEQVRDRFDAIFRHGARYIETDKRHHLAKVAVNAMFCWWHDKQSEGK